MAEDNTENAGVGLRDILTDERIEAMSRINRWNGFTKRPYSILEHTVIGVCTMVEHSLRYTKYDQRRFILHDVHESEICGDVSTPDKAKYMNRDYYLDVTDFDVRLLYAAGITKAARIPCPPADEMDAIMKYAEHDIVVSVDRGVEPMWQNRDEYITAARFIQSAEYRDDLAVAAFHYHMGRLFGRRWLS